MKHKKLIAAALAVAVLGGLYAWLMLNPAAEEDEDAEQPILSLEKNELSALTVTPAGGTEFTIRLTQDGSTTVYTMSDSAHDYDDTQMSELVSAVCELSGQKIESGSKRLDTYGLEKGGTSVRIRQKSGTSTLLLGKENTALGGTYCRLDGSDDVYLLSTDTAAQLTADLISYRQLLVAGGYYDLYSDMDSLTISGSGRTAIAAGRRSMDGIREDAADAYSDFVFLQPVPCAADDSAFSDGLLTQLQYALTAQSIAEDDPSDLSRYGLDDPVSIRIKTDNADFTILVGAADGDGGRYLMREGGSTVFISDASNLEFLDKDWRAYRSDVLLSFGRTELKRITLSEGDTLHRVDFSQTDEKDDDGDTLRTTTAKYNGTDMTDDAMDACYTNYSSIRFTEQLDGAPSGSPKYTASVELEDGTRHTVSFVKHGSRTYAANVDGGAEWFSVPQDTVTALLDSMTAGDAKD